MKYNQNFDTYQITDFGIYDIRNEVYMTDNIGRIIAMKLSDGEITEVHSFYQTAITSLCFSPNQSYLGVFYSTGCCHLLSSQSFMVELNLIDHQHDPNVGSRHASLLKIKEDLRRMKDVPAPYPRTTPSRASTTGPCPSQQMSS